ncbi:MAG: hypothetical protein ACKESB_03820 [Candidatus Hodgkinia cicadicola]
MSCSRLNAEGVDVGVAGARFCDADAVMGLVGRWRVLAEVWIDAFKRDSSRPH